MSVFTPARLNALKSWPHLKNSWHYLAATTLSVYNKSADIPILYQHAMKDTADEDQLKLTSQFRESILKSAALIGLPRTINGLTVLKNATPEHLRATELLRTDKTDFRKEGRDLFDQVYGKITTRVRTNLHNAYPDLDWFIENFEYGPLLSHSSVLGPKETSMTIIASLIPQDADPQLRGHLKGALNNGNTIDEVNSLRSMVMELLSYYGHEFHNPVSKL